MRDIHKHRPVQPRIPDVSPMLLWDVANTSLEWDDLGGAMAEAAPYARARRLQIALAEASAGGMSDRVLLAVLADWGCVAMHYQSDPRLAGAVEIARCLAEQGRTPQTVAAVERWADACPETGQDSGALAGLRRAIETFEGDPPEERDDQVWLMALEMFAGLAAVAGDDTPAALNECAAAMSRRIYRW